MPRNSSDPNVKFPLEVAIRACGKEATLVYPMVGKPTVRGDDMKDIAPTKFLRDAGDKSKTSFKRVFEYFDGDNWRPLREWLLEKKIVGAEDVAESSKKAAKRARVEPKVEPAQDASDVESEDAEAEVRVFALA